MNDRSDIVPTLEARQVDEGLRLWWFGGPSYAIKSPRTIVYVDPFHSGPREDNAQGFIRAIPNYFFPDTVKRADMVISTHDHLDHCDPDTLRPIYANTNARFAAAPSSARMMAGWGFAAERVWTMRPGATLTVGDVTLMAYPSRDYEEEDAATFVLTSGGCSVFIGGDTLYLDDLVRVGREHTIDLAIFALARNRPDIIAQQVYADAAEIARAARALGARRVLPVHWDIWREWVEDPHTVAPHLVGSGIEPVILGQGDSLII